MEFSFTESCIKNFGISFNLISEVSHILIIILGFLSLITVISILAYRIYQLTLLQRQSETVHKKLLNSYKFIYITSFALVVTGGLINMIFRAINGYVCDYIEFTFQSTTIYFNVPDIMIVTGIAIFAIIELVGKAPSSDKAFVNESK